MSATLADAIQKALAEHDSADPTYGEDARIAARAARAHIAGEVRATARSLLAVGNSQASKTAYSIAVQIDRGEMWSRPGMYSAVREAARILGLLLVGALIGWAAVAAFAWLIITWWNS